MTTAVSVIIPVRNEGRRLHRTIDSLIKGRSCAFPLQIIIVDDACIDGCCEGLFPLIVGAKRVELRVLRLQLWSGIPFARNLGAKYAIHPILLITDGNTRFVNGWDLAIAHNMHRNRILAGTIIDQSSHFSGFGCLLELPSMGVRWLPSPYVFDGFTPVAASTCTVIERDLFNHLQGYDETLPLYGAAEPEFSVRAWLSGYEIVVAPELLVFHRFRPRAQYNAFRCSIQNVLIRNYLRFACYYLPEDLLQGTYDYYYQLAPAAFDQDMHAIVSDGVWHRRHRLQQCLPRDFSWFASYFDLLPRVVT